MVTDLGASLTDVTIVDNTDGTLTLTQDLLGTTVDPVPHDEDDMGAGSIGTAVPTAGAASNLQNKFHLQNITAGTSFHVWSDVNGQGSDPAPGGSTAISTTIATGATANAVATAVAAAIDGNGNFLASATGSQVRVRNVATGQATDATAGDSGFTVTTLRQGMIEKYTPDSSPEDILVTPILITDPT